MVVPKIRFEGFDSDWEEKSFSELYRLNVRKNDLIYGNKDIISVAKMFYSPDPTITNEDYLKTYNIMEVGDIAFEGNKSKSFAYGRFVENDIGNGIVSHVFQVFSPIIDMDVAFWKYLINDEHVMRHILANSTKTSTMMREIVPSRFLKQTICVPCLEEQKKVGQLLGLVDRLINLYGRVISVFDLLVKSRFIDMFGHVDQNEKGFPILTLNEVSSKITDGSHFSPIEVENGPYPMLSVKDMQDSGFNYSNAKRIDESTYQSLISTGCQPIANDILIAKDGATAFQKGFVLNNSEPQALLSSIAIIRPDPTIVNPHYLLSFLFSDSIRQDILRNRVSGTAITRIILKELKKIPVMIPPIELQNEYVQLIQQVDKSKFNYIKKYEALKKLRESLICGMLIPVSNNEESKVRS